jgi:hypothetical protein
MPPRKESLASAEPDPKHQSRSTLTSQITAPAWLYSLLSFAIVALASLSLSMILLSLSKGIIQGDLAATSKRLDSWLEVSGLMTWRLVELGIAWISGCDAKSFISLQARMWDT